jgi:TRAP-type C4-dicarboxylate transport system substrate-binding protein
MDEYRGVKVIAMYTHGPGQIHTDADVNSLADLKDLKIRIGGGVAGTVGTALGVTGISVPAPKVYETLASKAADGVAMDVASRTGFKLTEVARNMYEMPGGFYRGAFALVMSQEKFDSLSPEVQKALDEQVFGLPTSDMFGRIWAEYDAEALEITLATEGNSVRTASDADKAEFAKITETVTKEVIDAINAKGGDGQAAYDMLKDELGDS